jgi:hypothetical protein
VAFQGISSNFSDFALILIYRPSWSIRRSIADDLAVMLSPAGRLRAEREGRI